MTVETTAPDLTEIRAAIVARMQELKPLVEECGRLEQAEAALEKAEAKANGRAAKSAVKAPLSEAELAQEAPYGYKADGTPRKRRPPADPDYARKGWETRQQRAQSES